MLSCFIADGIDNRTCLLLRAFFLKKRKEEENKKTKKNLIITVVFSVEKSSSFLDSKTKTLKEIILSLTK